MDEELEQVVEFVRQGLDGAGLRLRRGEGEGQREQRLVAGCEGDVLEVAEAVCDLGGLGIVSDQVQSRSRVGAGEIVEDECLRLLHVPPCH